MVVVTTTLSWCASAEPIQAAATVSSLTSHASPPTRRRVEEGEGCKFSSVCASDGTRSARTTRRGRDCGRARAFAHYRVKRDVIAILLWLGTVMGNRYRIRGFQEVMVPGSVSVLGRCAEMVGKTGKGKKETKNFGGRHPGKIEIQRLRSQMHR